MVAWGPEWEEEWIFNPVSSLANGAGGLLSRPPVITPKGTLNKDSSSWIAPSKGRVGMRLRFFCLYRF